MHFRTRVPLPGSRTPATPILPSHTQLDEEERRFHKTIPSWAAEPALLQHGLRKQYSSDSEGMDLGGGGGSGVGGVGAGFEANGCGAVRLPFDCFHDGRNTWNSRLRCDTDNVFRQPEREESGTGWPEHDPLLNNEYTVPSPYLPGHDPLLNNEYTVPSPYIHRARVEEEGGEEEESDRVPCADSYASSGECDESVASLNTTLSSSDGMRDGTASSVCPSSKGSNRTSGSSL